MAGFSWPLSPDYGEYSEPKSLLCLGHPHIGSVVRVRLYNNFGQIPVASSLHSIQDDRRPRGSDAAPGATHRARVCRVQAGRHRQAAFLPPHFFFVLALFSSCAAGFLVN